MRTGSPVRPDGWRGAHAGHWSAAIRMGFRPASALCRNLLENTLGIADGFPQRHAHDLHPFEALVLLHFDIHREDDKIRRADLLPGKLILDAHGALGFHLDPVPQS